MKLTNLKKGTLVNYHGIIGGPIDGQFEIREEPWFEENNKFYALMLKGKAGYVSINAVSDIEE
jgi:hypothetical protein